MGKKIKGLNVILKKKSIPNLNSQSCKSHKNLGLVNGKTHKSVLEKLALDHICL